MSERLSDELVANLAVWAADAKPTTREVEALAREVQEWRTAARHFPVAYFPPLADLCARHGITVEGIVALVDDTLRDITEPEHADITEAVEAGLNHDDMYYAGWEVGYFDAVTAARRLVLGEEA